MNNPPQDTMDVEKLALLLRQLANNQDNVWGYTATIAAQWLEKLHKENQELKTTVTSLRVGIVDEVLLTKQRDRAIADVKKLREVLKAVRDCDVPLENDSVPFIGLRELAEYILKSTNHYDD